MNILIMYTEKNHSRVEERAEMGLFTHTHKHTYIKYANIFRLIDPNTHTQTHHPAPHFQT
jgi:hypothetical protein